MLLIILKSLLVRIINFVSCCQLSKLCLDTLYNCKSPLKYCFDNSLNFVLELFVFLERVDGVEAGYY